ncbi:unnamed protein product [Allacma fusca]|uniref:Uncharacterized protein n=1 Tax=Allacma fusca TaxID=39272 RepID=A0A8J2LLQ1_9HEXA|nr:unnamed protein product [Allacma fusca]
MFVDVGVCGERGFGHSSSHSVVFVGRECLKHVIKIHLIKYLKSQSPEEHMLAVSYGVGSYERSSGRTYWTDPPTCVYFGHRAGSNVAIQFLHPEHMVGQS